MFIFLMFNLVNDMISSQLTYSCLNVFLIPRICCIVCADMLERIVHSERHCNKGTDSSKAQQVGKKKHEDPRTSQSAGVEGVSQ